MGFLNRVFKTKGEPVGTYQAFWDWFNKNQRVFYKVVESEGDIDEVFFSKLASKLNELREGIFFLTGMCNSTTVELIITPDSDVRNIAFVEELVQAAPKIEGWKFTAFKPALDIKNVSIEMEGFKFNESNISFYANHIEGCPDEVDITIVHQDYDEQTKDNVTTGVHIFIENYLGELDFISIIDNLRVCGIQQSEKEVIPIAKLKDYLKWRQKEFVEKYEAVRHNTENDTCSILEAELENGNMLIAVINTDLLQWDGKASHPWILNVEIPYDGKTNNGMPGKDTYKLLDEIEDKLIEELKDFEGCLSIGRQTADNMREIYFACKDFRIPSKVLYNMQKEYNGTYKISFTIYKDKYWQSFNRFT